MDRHAGGEPQRHPAHIARRLQHHRAGREQARAVMGRAGDAPHLGRVQDLAGLTQGGEVRGIGDIAVVRALAGGAVDLAVATEIPGRDAVFPDRIGPEGDRVAVHGDQPPVAVGTGARVILGSQLMRQVDHEARVAPRRALADLPGVQQRDPRPRRKLQKPPRGGKPREAAADDGEVGGMAAFRRRHGNTRRKDRVPGCGSVQFRQPRRPVDGGRACPRHLPRAPGARKRVSRRHRRCCRKGRPRSS